MNYELQCVEESHKLFGTPIHQFPDDKIAQSEIDLRQRLVREETDELVSALGHNDIVEFADAIADVMVVVAGTCVQMGARPEPEDARTALAILVMDIRDLLCKAIYQRSWSLVRLHATQMHVVMRGAAAAWGIPYLEVFNEVHRSNLAKVGMDGVIKVDAGGKWIKPTDWRPPNVRKILEDAGICLPPRKDLP